VTCRDIDGARVTTSMQVPDVVLTFAVYDARRMVERDAVAKLRPDLADGSTYPVRVGNLRTCAPVIAWPYEATWRVIDDDSEENDR